MKKTPKEMIKELKRKVKVLKGKSPSVASKFILADYRAYKDKYNIKD
jgi:hypothetical protein